jgi:predicted transcriptional regulator
MDTLYRTQILLEPEQHRKLKEIAQYEGRSVSELMREILRDYLDEQERGKARLRELQALAELARVNDLIRERQGVYQQDLIAEVRDERDQDIERAMRGES